MFNRKSGAFRTRCKKGFTIIETILAITVIGLVIAATVQLTQGSLRIGRSTIEQFAAFHTAEEGLEIVRAVRDSNWLQNRAWRIGLADGLYIIGENRPWHLEHIIRSDADDYERVIEIRSVGEALRATSTVTFMQQSTLRQISLEAELTDWKKGPL